MKLEELQNIISKKISEVDQVLYILDLHTIRGLLKLKGQNINISIIQNHTKNNTKSQPYFRNFFQ